MHLVPMPDADFQYFFQHAAEVTFRQFKTERAQAGGFRDAILPDRSGIMSPEQVARLQSEARRLRRAAD